MPTSTTHFKNGTEEMNIETSFWKYKWIADWCKNIMRKYSVVTVQEQEADLNSEAVDMNGRFQIQGGKNWILPK